MGAFRFEANDGDVCKVDASTGRIVSRRAPLGTKVVQVLGKNDSVIVREDYYQFPSGSSNVYCLSQELEIIWTAQLPLATDIYANVVTDRGDTLECASWEGVTCQIDPVSGKIVQTLFTK